MQIQKLERKPTLKRRKTNKLKQSGKTPVKFKRQNSKAELLTSINIGKSRLNFHNNLKKKKPLVRSQTIQEEHESNLSSDRSHTSGDDSSSGCD